MVHFTYVFFVPEATKDEKNKKPAVFCINFDFSVKKMLAPKKIVLGANK